MNLTINGESKNFEASLSVEQLLGQIGLDAAKVAVERNREIVPKSGYGQTMLSDGDNLEIVHFIGGGSSNNDGDSFEVAGQSYWSRLLVGTGKYKDFEETKKAVEASGAEIVTVAVRRVNVTNPKEPMLVDYLDPKITHTYPIPLGVIRPMKPCVRSGLRAKRAAGIW